jgi:biopolymer transport protein ExbB/TolQ
MDPGMNIETRALDIMLRAGSRWVLWLLLGLSVVALGVVLERIVVYLLELRPRLAIATALRRLRAEGPAAALAALAGQRSMDVAVARACLEHADDGPAAIEEHLAAAVDAERLRYERGLAFLGTLGNNAPFIGLFGTVLGIVRAFHDLAGNTTQGTAAVMAGIAEALVATGVGLLVALPAVAAYNALMRHVEAVATSAGALGHEILGHLKSTRPAAAERAKASGTEGR